MTSHPSSRPGLWPFVAIALAVLLFSNAFPAVKVCLDALSRAEIAQPAFALVPLRFVPAALAFLILGLTALRREALAIMREHPVRVVLAALAVVPGYNIFFNLGMQTLTPGVASLIIATAPIQTLLLSIPLLGERARPRQLIGIAVAFAGIVVVVRLGQGRALGASVDWSLLRGVLFTLIAPGMWALYTILLKPVMARHEPVPVTAVAVVIGTVPMLALWRGEAATALMGDAVALTAWIFLSLGATVLAFYFWNVPLKVISPTALALCVHFIPLSAITWSIVLWRTEVFNWWLAAGAAVVISGVAMANAAFGVRRVGPRGVPIPDSADP